MDDIIQKTGLMKLKEKEYKLESDCKEYKQLLAQEKEENEKLKQKRDELKMLISEYIEGANAEYTEDDMIRLREELKNEWNKRMDNMINDFENSIWGEKYAIKTLFII